MNTSRSVKRGLVFLGNNRGETNSGGGVDYLVSAGLHVKKNIKLTSFLSFTGAESCESFHMSEATRFLFYRGRRNRLRLWSY